MIKIQRYSNNNINDKVKKFYFDKLQDVFHKDI